MLTLQSFRLFAPVALFALCVMFVDAAALAASVSSHTSKVFEGAKANTGTVTHSVVDGKDMLTLSADFKTPDAPAPHWQIVDSAGHTYLLQRLMVKDGMSGKDKLNRSIVVPTYIRDIARVQIWCSFAETLLGETTFETTITLGNEMSMTDMHTSSMFMGVKANTGTVTIMYKNGQRVLTLSEDFKTPDAPAPHWQIVDSRGNTYLLQSLNIKGNKMNRSIVVPDYICDVATVQMWCAYAEVLLGEASFAAPVR